MYASAPQSWVDRDTPMAEVVVVAVVAIAVTVGAEDRVEEPDLRDAPLKLLSPSDPSTLMSLPEFGGVGGKEGARWSGYVMVP